jgi:hypothetical protein
LSGAQRKPKRPAEAALRRILPRTYLAYALAAAAGIAMGLHFEAFARVGAFLCTYGVLSLALSHVLLGRRAAQTLYPALTEPQLGRLLMIRLTIFAPFMALGVGGATILGSMNRPILMAIEVGVAAVVSAVGGLAFGALVYFIRRLSELQRDRAN